MPLAAVSASGIASTFFLEVKTTTSLLFVDMLRAAGISEPTFNGVNQGLAGLS